MYSDNNGRILRRKIKQNTMMIKSVAFSLLALIIYATTIEAYSALEDAKIIAEYKSQHSGRNHAKIVRQLVHQAKWSAVGTISTNSHILNYPMVNTISVDDSALTGESTGKIHFLLTDLDFTGQDWQKANKVTFLFSDEQNLHCTNNNIDPMEPTCPRTIISGQVKQLDVKAPTYNDAVKAFIKRHPAASHWIAVHKFYLCELDIENIYILDFYGGPHLVSVEDYYKITL